VKKKRKTKSSSPRKEVSPALGEDPMAFEQTSPPGEQGEPVSEEQAAPVFEETALVFEEIQAVFEEVPPSIDAVFEEVPPSIEDVFEEEQPYIQAASAAAPAFAKQQVVVEISLTRLLDLSLPGKYLVNVSRQVDASASGAPSDPFIVSNTVAFELKEQ